MQTMYAEIELSNATQQSRIVEVIEQTAVRKVQTKAVVNSGAWMMGINEKIREQLDLLLIENREVELASSEIVQYSVVGPLKVKFANRTAICSSFILPDDSEPVLGILPMQEMDVLIDANRQELIVNPAHPNYAQLKMK